MVEVYNWDNKNYDMNGDMTMQPSYAILKVELNGICEIEIEHPYDKLGRWKYLIEDAVVAAPTPWSKKQLFRIYDTEKTLTGLKVYARHIYFDLVKSNIESNMHIKNKNGQEALEMILKDTGYTAHSNIVIINNCHFFKDNVIQGISGSQENTFLKRWSGEMFLDNFDVYINRRIGGDYGVRVSYANNMEDLSLKRNMEEVFTRLQPYVIKNTTDTIELPEKYVDSPSIDKFAKVYEKYIDLSEYMHLKENEDDIENAYATEKELHVAMRNKCKELFKEGVDKPKVTGSVNMILLENTVEYEHVKDLVKVNLGDDVKVEHLDIGIETQTRCVGYTWNILTERYININLGELESDYFDIQSSTTNDLNNVLNDNGTLNSAKMQGLIDGLKTKFNVYRDIEQKLQIRAMLFEDKIKGSATYGAMALGTMGFEIAHERTPDDRDWDWRTFGTGKGFIADCIIAGTLRTVTIESMDKSFKIDLNKSGGALFKNNGKEAIEIRNNAANFYNWAKAGELIGSLTSLIRGSDKNKPLIGLVNERNSAVSIGYKDSKADNIYPSYVEFDKYNTLNNYKPIRIYENVSLGEASLFFGANDIGELFSTSDGDIAFKTKHAFGIVDKDSRYWTSFLGSDNIFFAHWKTGEKYFWVNPSRFSMPGFWRGDDGEIWSGVTLNVDKNFHVNGNITCSGKKNRMVETDYYGKRLQNAIESPECWFIDYGEGKIVNGKAIIKIDPIHLETINTDYKYIVRVWSDDGTRVWCRKSKRYKQYFIVEGEADCDFEYEFIAKQKGYENVRLEEVIKDEKYYLDKRENKGKGGMFSGTSKEGNSTN